MGKSIFDILNKKKRNIAILIDPEKTNLQEDIRVLVSKIEQIDPAFIFVGGSTVSTTEMKICLTHIKKFTSIPLVLFPGSHRQISEIADGILFLSLISGRNPDYLIGHQVESAHYLKEMNIEVMPTGYILIDGGKTSAVAYVSQTTPIPSEQNSIAVKTAIAGELLGMQAIFLDAGSGAKNPIPAKMIRAVKQNTNIPLIVGGGLQCINDIENAFEAGANLVVIGNKIENDIDFLLDIKLMKKSYFD